MRVRGVVPARRLLSALLLVCLAGLPGLAGCTGSSSGGEAAGPAAAGSASAGAVGGSGTAGDPALLAAPMHGLVVVTKQWLSGSPPNAKLWVVGYDPGTGAWTATRYFHPAGGETMSFTEVQQAPYQRQAFADDYRLVSATSKPDAAGGTTAGVVRSGDGRFRQLTTPHSGAQAQTIAGPFNPRTGRLWFAVGGARLGSVDPGRASDGGFGSGSGGGGAGERLEPGTVRAAGGGVVWHGFTPTGFGPVWDTTVNGGRTWYFPDGQMMAGGTSAFAFGREGKIGPGSKPALALPKGVRGYPVAVVDDVRFVLVSVAGTELHLVTRSAKKLTSVPLLARPAGAQILGAVVAPQRDRVAFRSADGGLYVVPLTGMATPRKVADVPFGLTDRKSMLIDWLP